ncbi:hypothetical protein [Mesorhizobium sp. KR1-2]|uniref:hypothetical protein n=1 Tax=Mesorhizobium sp. KR1-2 TaxID=3156609 RepID=UPI0032B4AE2C
MPRHQATTCRPDIRLRMPKCVGQALITMLIETPSFAATILNKGDIAAAGAGAIAAKGARRFVLLVPRGPDAATLEKRVAQ